jgi:hypothetical protein
MYTICGREAAKGLRSHRTLLFSSRLVQACGIKDNGKERKRRISDREELEQEQEGGRKMVLDSLGFGIFFFF